MAMSREENEVDYYTVLEVTPHSSSTDIKRSFQRLIKKCHPDKLPLDASQSERDTATKQFHRITRAYQILSDIPRKLQYDATVNAELVSQKWPVSAVVDLDDMTFDPDQECYQLPCRCGGCYVASEGDLGDGVELVCCSTCSLSIKILYQVHDEQT